MTESDFYILATALAALSFLVAVGAAVVAGFARADSKRSADAAEVSAEASRDAATAAAEEVTLIRQQQARETERTDVDWQIDVHPSTRLVRVTNDGSTPACEVSVSLKVRGERFTYSRERLDPGESIEHDASSAFAAQPAGSRPYSTGSIFFAPRPAWDIEARVTWQSPQGTPSVVVLRPER